MSITTQLFPEHVGMDGKGSGTCPRGCSQQQELTTESILEFLWHVVLFYIIFS